MIRGTYVNSLLEVNDVDKSSAKLILTQFAALTTMYLNQQYLTRLSLLLPINCLSCLVTYTILGAMAQIPPTPLMPSRYTDGWNLEDESLLMDQQPIFGDESMLDMTFEMGTEDGDDGDLSSGTIVAVDLDVGHDNDKEESQRDDDGQCEAARDAQASLGHMNLPAFHNESQDDINLLQDLDPFDYPPSPFLNRSTYYANQQNVDVGSPTQVRQEEDIQEETTFTSQMKIVNPAQIEAVPTDPSLSMQSEPLELMLEETTFSARGEKSTWAEEDRDSSLGPGGSMSSSVASGRGKRQASSPRRATVTKKSMSLVSRAWCFELI